VAQQGQGLVERQLVYFSLGGASGASDAAAAGGEQQRPLRRTGHVEGIEGLSVPDFVDDQ
jgi:hypothetical protein